MIKDSITNLIAEMQEVKAAHSSLSISEVLKIFEIKAIKNLTRAIGRLNNGR